MNRKISMDMLDYHHNSYRLGLTINSVYPDDSLSVSATGKSKAPFPPVIPVDLVRGRNRSESSPNPAS
jgi:hypothetical protein